MLEWKQFRIIRVALTAMLDISPIICTPVLHMWSLEVNIGLRQGFSGNLDHTNLAKLVSRSPSLLSQDQEHGAVSGFLFFFLFFCFINVGPGTATPATHACKTNTLLIEPSRPISIIQTFQIIVEKAIDFNCLAYRTQFKKL